MVNNLGDTICSFRKKKDLSQREFAALLDKRGVKVTNQAVSKWESGASLPNAVQFLIICDILDIIDISGIFNNRSYDFLDGLSEEGRKRVYEYADMVRDSGLYDDPNLPPPRGTKIRTLPVYDLDAAIGKGRLLDLPDYIPTKVGNEVPLSANFGIIISGDSMEPDYHNGQVVWIQQQAKLEHGDVGVFTYEGNTYFKRLRDRVGGTRLQSIDSNYPDIIITDPEAIITLGKVIE
ncbi:MAG: LexA family transcriptional regulator [Clostridiales bacterium]|mgnify:CR=1 FL=1|jgi:repressor LexA|nr:LexA family transcriptional regulator [Clostridiales bacterium]